MPTHITSGVSFEQVSHEAGVKAARTALKQLAGTPASLAVLFASPAHDLNSLLKGVRSVLPASTLVAGGFSDTRFWEDESQRSGVSVSLIATDEYAFSVTPTAWAKQDAMSALRMVRSKLNTFLAAPGISSFLSVMDDVTDSKDVCLASVQNLKSDVHLAGGEVNPFSKTAGVIANDMVLPGGIAVCAAKGPRPFFSGVFPTHKAIRGPITAPKSEVDDYSPLRIPQRIPRPKLQTA